jgi:hypothetical protein
MEDLDTTIASIYRINEKEPRHRGSFAFILAIPKQTYCLRLNRYRLNKTKSIPII